MYRHISVGDKLPDGTVIKTISQAKKIMKYWFDNDIRAIFDGRGSWSIEVG